jgi:energy-coupling factor transporter ATP-binding protein EcfA2
MSFIVGDARSDQELTETFKKWYKATNREQITLVTAGRSGAGKSTLIGNMLQLKDDAAPKSQHHSTSTTTEVKLYQKSVNGREVRIIDTPGLATTDVSEAKIIAELQDRSGGKADMLLYCISILPDSKIDEQDEKIIKTLKMAFGHDIWRHAILVLTFANYVIHDLEEGTTLSGLVDDYATTFQSKLRNICPSFSVVSIFSCDQDEVKRDPKTIIALPAGRNPSKNLVEGMKWDESIYMEVLKKCNPDVVPALLNVREPTPKIIRQIAQLFKITGSAAFAGAFVGTVGAITGTLAGAGLGALAGGVGIVPGAAVGADIGAGIGLSLAGGGAGGLAAVATGWGAYLEGQEREEEESKLEEFQEALQQEKLKK